MARNTSETYSNYVAESLFEATRKWSDFSNHEDYSLMTFSEALRERRHYPHILVCYPVVASELFIALVES